MADDGCQKTEGTEIRTEVSTDAIASITRDWMLKYSLSRGANMPTLSANQKTSLSAMIAYISNRSGESEFRIERSLSDHFNVPNPKLLPAKCFDEALRYLVDSLPA